MNKKKRRPIHSKSTGPWHYIPFSYKMFKLFATTACGLLSFSEYSAPPRKSVKSIISSRPLRTSKCTLLLEEFNRVKGEEDKHKTQNRNSYLDGKQANRPTVLKAWRSIANFNGAWRPSNLRSICMSRSKTFCSCWKVENFRMSVVKLKSCYCPLCIDLGNSIFIPKEYLKLNVGDIDRFTKPGKIESLTVQLIWTFRRSTETKKSRNCSNKTGDLFTVSL